MQRPVTHFRAMAGIGGGDQQPGHECLKPEATIETPSDLADVALSVLEEAEGVMSPIQRSFQITQHHIDPAGTGSLRAGLAASRHDHGMRMLKIDGGAECTQAITVHLGFIIQMALKPAVQRGQTNPSGQRAFCRARSHAARVPYCARNSGKDNSC